MQTGPHRPQQRANACDRLGMHNTVLLLSSAAALLCRNKSCTTQLVICQDPEVLQGCLDANKFMPGNTVQQLFRDSLHHESEVGINFITRSCIAGSRPPCLD